MYLKCNKSTFFITKDRKLDKIPILFIHGFTGSSKSWNNIRSNVHHPSFAIDLPGHAKSTFNSLSEKYFFKDFTNELYIILNKLNITNMHLCGYSMGGRLSTYFASRYPSMIESLILESTSLGIKDRDERHERYIEDNNIAITINENMNEFITTWEDNKLFEKQAVRNKSEYLQQRDIRSSHTKKQLSHALKIFSIGNMPYLLKDFQELNFPINIINGKDDIKYIKEGRDMLKLNNKAKQYIIDKASHNVHLENERLYIDLLNSITDTI